jgi:hypothetical protein
MGELTKEKLNGIDTEALKQVMEQVSTDPSVGKSPEGGVSNG